MKKCVVVVAILLVSLASAAQDAASPHKVALVVQNHCSGNVQPPMSALADTLAASLSEQGLSVVNPANSIGTMQNVLPIGEAMPAASAKELGSVLGVDGILAASIQEFTSESIGVPPVAYALKTRLTLTLFDCSTGESVCGISKELFSKKNYTVEQVKEDNAALFEGFLHSSAEKCAGLFFAKYAKTKWTPAAVQKVNVFFGCNVLGADIQIDGMSYGTCPAQIALTPGVHNLLVSYPPYYLDFERTARFADEGQAYKVVLVLTKEGEAQRDRALDYRMKLLELRKGEMELDKAGKDNALDYEKKKEDFARRRKELEVEMSERCELFKKQLDLADAMLERYSLSGDADDYVRKTIADGTATYWKNSFGRVVITEGNVDNIELATPTTDAGDLSVPPSPNEIGEGLKKLLMKRK